MASHHARMAAGASDRCRTPTAVPVRYTVDGGARYDIPRGNRPRLPMASVPPKRSIPPTRWDTFASLRFECALDKHPIACYRSKVSGVGMQAGWGGHRSSLIVVVSLSRMLFTDFLSLFTFIKAGYSEDSKNTLDKMWYVMRSYIAVCLIYILNWTRAL